MGDSAAVMGISGRSPRGGTRAFRNPRKRPCVPLRKPRETIVAIFRSVALGRMVRFRRGSADPARVSRRRREAGGVVALAGSRGREGGTGRICFSRSWRDAAGLGTRRAGNDGHPFRRAQISGGGDSAHRGVFQGTSAALKKLRAIPIARAAYFRRRCRHGCKISPDHQGPESQPALQAETGRVNQGSETARRSAREEECEDRFCTEREPLIDGGVARFGICADA